MIRIMANTGMIGICGFFTGIGKAIYRNQSKTRISLLYLGGSVLSGLTHQLMNEIITGILIR